MFPDEIKRRTSRLGRLTVEPKEEPVNESSERPVFLSLLRVLEKNNQGLREATTILRGLGDSLYGEQQGDEAVSNPAPPRPHRGLVGDFTDTADHQDELVRELFQEVERLRRLFP